MPEGYYSGDKPNPNLRAFVEQHLREKPYDPLTDAYEVPAFDKPIMATKATAIYNMHTYWSKKPHGAIREYIRHYTQPGDLVLDPFCGSGSTALAALMEGRKVIAIDRSPAATFITKNYCTPVDVEALQAAFAELQAKVKPEIDWLYETRCDRCGGKATTAYTVYSQVFRCDRCFNPMPLFDCVEAENSQGKVVKACPICQNNGFVEEISTRNNTKLGAIPVLVSYLCQNGCKPVRAERRYNDPIDKKREYFEKYDLAKLKEIEAKPIPHWYPPNRMMNVEDATQPWGDKWRAGTSNFRTVAELFTKRNLWALAVILDVCNASQFSTALSFVFESNILSATIMQQYREAGGGFAKGTYYVPQVYIEREQSGCFVRKFNDIVNAQREMHNGIICTEVLVSTQSNTDIAAIPANSIGYVFTDPPYADKVQYGELNFVWEAWLGFDTHWQDDEIIVNNVRGKTEQDWADMMRQAMAECYRVLKPGRWISLCYHDTSEGTWALLQDIMAEAGFIVDKSTVALFIDTGQKSYNQLTADKVTKRDLVINFRKPKPGEAAGLLTITGDEDETTFREKVHTVIRDHLAAHPGASKDHIYDDLVSRMVKSGRMQPHDFDLLLAEVADHAVDVRGKGEGERWYLKEAQLALVDAAESAHEDAAADQLGQAMHRRQVEQPAQPGMHYSDLFELFVYGVKDKPRRALAEWLPDYFFKTETGAWRLPVTDDEQQAKIALRREGVSRHIRHYVAHLQQGTQIPAREQPGPATLVGWIRHCKRAGLYEAGVLLFERGGLTLEHLPEELAVNVEEDYQVCVKRVRPGRE